MSYKDPLRPRKLFPVVPPRRADLAEIGLQSQGVRLHPWTAPPLPCQTRSSPPALCKRLAGA